MNNQFFVYDSSITAPLSRVTCLNLSISIPNLMAFFETHHAKWFKITMHKLKQSHFYMKYFICDFMIAHRFHFFSYGLKSYTYRPNNQYLTGSWLLYYILDKSALPAKNYHHSHQAVGGLVSISNFSILALFLN